jgi:hypothetical protein
LFLKQGVGWRGSPPWTKDTNFHKKSVQGLALPLEFVPALGSAQGLLSGKTTVIPLLVAIVNGLVEWDLP